MYRLSLVIPFVSEPEPFEDTLVSVLQNRPANCEVIVVHRGPYDDPYELRDEVCFVEVPTETSTMQSINAGLTAARGEVVHLLQPGVLAIEGWTKPALARFDDPTLGAVAPVVLGRSNPDRVVSAGMRFTAGGARRVNGVGTRSATSKRLARRAMAGPTLTAAFYRKTALMALGGLPEVVGERLADADLAISLRALGWGCVLEPACQLVGDAKQQPAPLSFAAGRCDERLFLRYAATHGMFPVVVFHLFAILGGWLCRAYRWGAYSHLLGRLAACCENRREYAPPTLLDELRARGSSPADSELVTPSEALNRPARTRNRAA
ncbi:MAG: glycosyltransferase family 2 protein [Planctomycetota bacterium]|nr:glycosyltransferase family 2 protein [Planctomycetota bacterium]